MTATPPPKRRPGRPPLPPDQRRGNTPVRAIRLTDAEWAELQRRGLDALRAWLRASTPPTA